MKNILFVLLAFFILKGVSLTEIEVIPPTQSNILARGYSGFVLRVIFKKEIYFTTCNWEYDEDPIPGDVGRLQFYVPGVNCTDKNSRTESITCVERVSNGESFITSNLTYLQRLTSDTRLGVRCNKLIDFIQLQVLDCEKNLPSNVSVISNSTSYSAIGVFTCSGIGALYYSNGSSPESNLTTCQYTAEWSGKNGLQCWSAPTSAISSNSSDFTVVEGDSLNVTCSSSGGVPSVDAYNFFIDGDEVKENEELQSPSYILTSLQRGDNTKEVSCEAMNQYTRLSMLSWRSPGQTINVHYAPFQDLSTTCNWVLNQREMCQTVFMANPAVTFVNFTKDGQLVEHSIDSQKEILPVGPSYTQTFTFIKEQVQRDDFGRYTLFLNSSIPPYIYNMSFNVEATSPVVTVPNSFPAEINVIAIVLPIVFVLLVIIVIIGAVYYRRRKEKRNASQLSGPSAGASEMALTTPFQTKGAIDKEEFENPSYTPLETADPAGDTYAVVNKSKKADKNSTASLEKEEKENPLYYLSVAGTEIEDSYAFVDKKDKPVTGSSEKEEKVNPLYAPSFEVNQTVDVYAALDKKKKKKTASASAEKQGKGKAVKPPSEAAVPTQDTYAMVNKNKNNSVSSEKEEKANPLYAPSLEVNQGGDVYAAVDKKKKKKTASASAEKEGRGKAVKLKPQSEVVVPTQDTYAMVNKNKNNSVSSEKAEKSNPLYAPSLEVNQGGDVYAAVDKKKRKKTASASAEKEERGKAVKPPSEAVVPTQDTYAMVNKNKNNSAPDRANKGFLHEIENAQLKKTKPTRPRRSIDEQLGTNVNTTKR